MEDAELSAMIVFAKQVAIAQRRAVPCRRIGVSVIGLEVPHAHIHLIPINTMGDWDFKKDKLNLSPEEFSSIAANISSQMA